LFQRAKVLRNIEFRGKRLKMDGLAARIPISDAAGVQSEIPLVLV